MPSAVQREVQDVLRDTLNRMQRDAMSLVPVDQGDLRDSIEVKLSRDKLSGIVGPGVSGAEIVRKKAGSTFGGTKINMRASTKHMLLQFFKGYWVEFGTKGSAKKNIPAQPARPFMRPAYDANVRQAEARIRRGVKNALEQVSKDG